MEKEQFEEKMRIFEKELKIKFNEKQLEQFYQYMQLLLDWNKRINLTAITEPNEVILKHFIDSLTIHSYMEKASYMADIGTGAGFPGIPLKIFRPDLNIVLIDSLNKRVNFLQEVINQLSLDNISAVHGRIEELGKNKKYREQFEVVTSRAVANLSVLSEYMVPLTKIKGIAIAMKGSEIQVELENSKKAIQTLGGKIKLIDEFLLPTSDMKRNIVIIEKEKITPNQFPRKPGIPTKEPIM